MSKIVDFPSDELRLEAAGEWLMLLDERALTQEEQTDFKHWLNSSRQNPVAFEEVARVWGKMEILAGMAELFPLGSLEAEQAMSEIQPAIISRSVISRSVIGLARAAGVFVLAVTSVYLFNQYGFLTEDALDHQRYITDVGETETIDLEDGSIITANTDSELRVSVGEDERRIELTRGEAYFEVAHDPDRPFTVHAGNGYVRAVGTAFSVYNNQGKVEVIVTEGSVEVVSSESESVYAIYKARDKSVILESGQIAEYDDRVELYEAVDPEDISRQLFWKQGMLAFEGQSLEEVIAEFSRYTKTDIEIISDDIRDIRVGGYFQSDDLGGMLSALESNFGIKVTEVNPSLVHLSAM